MWCHTLSLSASQELVWWCKMRPPPHCPFTLCTSSPVWFSSPLCLCQACDLSLWFLDFESKAFLCLSLSCGSGWVGSTAGIGRVGEEGGDSIFIFYNKGPFFKEMSGCIEGWKGSRAAICGVSKTMPYGDHHICGWQLILVSCKL